MTFQATVLGLEHWQVDVFSNRPLRGNPLGVIFDADGLDGPTRQSIARETGLSETVFLGQPRQGGDISVCIHTARREIPFAVHPAVGAAHAFVERTGFVGDSLSMECGAGLVVISRHHAAPGWFVRVRDCRFVPVQVARETAAVWLGLHAGDIVSQTVEVADAGVPWLLVEVASLANLAHLVPDHTAIAAATRACRAVGLTVFTRSTPAGIAARMRSFAPAEGIFEDPVCGSCAASLAGLLRRDDAQLARAPLISFEQGHEIGRDGLVHAVLIPGGQAVGGPSVTVLRGHLTIGD